MKIKHLFLAALASVSLFSCQNNEKKKAEEVAQLFFETYAERKDYNKIKSFYNDSVAYENVIQNTSTINFETGYLLNNVLSWNDKSIAYEGGKALKVKEIISNDTVVVVNGEFNSYTYNGFQFLPMRFTTYLYLDKNYKIVKQVDWFNYPIGDLIELYQLQESKKFQVDQ